MEHIINTEAVIQAAELIGLLAVGTIGIYAAIIAGYEVGGNIIGYPGRGREIHEQIMKSIFGNKRKK